MKNIGRMSLALACAALLFLLAACGGDVEPDFHSLYDSETKQTISLGEPLAEVTEKLGEGAYQSTVNGMEWYAYFDESLHISFMQGQVVAIIADAAPRYQIKNYKDGVFLVEVKDRFPDASALVVREEEPKVYTAYTAYYDETGEMVETPEDAYCSAWVLCHNAFSKLALAHEYPVLYEGFAGIAYNA